jgi:purine-binding chemotaxis protein CheW
MDGKESYSVGKSRPFGENKQYVTFFIMNEIYGVPVLKVQEITGMTKVTALTDTPRFMKGTIDLRGVPVPVIDMRLKFGLVEAEYNNCTVIIIIEVRERLMGMIVDSVSDVLNARFRSVREAPSFRTRIDAGYIKGIGQKNGADVIILDSDSILTANEFEMIYNFSETAQAYGQL